MLKMEMSAKLDKNSNLKKTTKRKKAYASRIEEVAAMRTKFPTKVPTIVKRFHKETSLPLLEKVKFLVPEETTMSQFVAIIRKRMNLRANQAIYLLVNNRSMMNLSMTIAEVYNEHKDEDGMLHVTYASQEVFGATDGSNTKNWRIYYDSGLIPEILKDLIPFKMELGSDRSTVFVGADCSTFDKGQKNAVNDCF